MQPGMADGPVAIVAGGGGLPGLLVETLRRRGRDVRVLALRGFADKSLMRSADAACNLLDVEGILRNLDTWRPSVVMLAGFVHRPNPLAAMSALSAFRNRHLFGKLIEGSDDRLLVAVVRLFEERGHHVAGIDSMAPELLARSGVLGRHAPDPAAREEITRGIALLSTLSPFDMGQAAVVSTTRIVAVEGPEGTDAMLKRVRGLWRSPRLRRRKPGGVLVKTAKLGQDFRVDLPVIGPRTVVRAAQARLDGIAIGAERTLIVDQERTLAEANRRGLFIVGVSPESLS